MAMRVVEFQVVSVWATSEEVRAELGVYLFRAACQVADAEYARLRHHHAFKTTIVRLAATGMTLHDAAFNFRAAGRARDIEPDYAAVEAEFSRV